MLLTTDLPSSASSAEPMITPTVIEHTIEGGYGAASYSGAASLDFGTLEASYRLSLPPGVAARAGMRVGFGENVESSVALEGFGMVLLEPRFPTITDDHRRQGVWRPSAGMEIGITTTRRDFPTQPVSATFDRQPPPVYIGFVAMPARFRVNQWSFGVLGLSVGTGIDHPGEILRFHLHVVHIGWVLSP
jgi:hypothetical protein